MERIASPIPWIAGILLFAGLIVSGQEQSSALFLEHPGARQVRESITVFTDRTLYAVGEKMVFKANYQINKEFQHQTWSSVLYVELVAQNGHPVVQTKYPLSLTGAYGEIPIPANLPTGNYFLKAYTKWMRNFPVEGYACKPLKVVNPFTGRPETTEAEENLTDPSILNPLPYDTAFILTVDKPRYGKREKVTVYVTLSPGSAFQGEVAVSVSKAGTNSFGDGYSGSDNLFLPGKGDLQFYPEPRGVTISGKVIHSITKKEEPEALVHLSLLDSPPFYSCFLTNPQGGFLFTLPVGVGACDFYTEALKEELPLFVAVDPEFCDRPFTPGVLPFELTPLEKEIAADICVNMQIAALNIGKSPEKVVGATPYGAESYGFYGDPTRVIPTGEYIELTNIREFMFELVPEFTIETTNKIPGLKVTKRNSLTAYPPLYLIDQVPVTNPAKFLNILTEKIEKIEVIDKGYLIGNVNYNGIVQAFSKKRDLAGIELPKNSQFFKYNLYSRPDHGVISANVSEPLPIRNPDRRNTLYWNPAFHPEAGKRVEFSFYTADMSGEYEILIRGISRNTGKTAYGKAGFVVQ